MAEAPQAIGNAARRLAPSLQAVGIESPPPAKTEKRRTHRLERASIYSPELDTRSQPVHEGRLAFAQFRVLVPNSAFRRCVRRYQ
jgi:hypothetical protein